MSSLALAHIGDAVFELWVRSGLCLNGGSTNGQLHRDTVVRVCAPAQALVAQALMPHLTPEELDFYRRGKNAHVSNIPKNATPTQYSQATGLEALLGALWLLGRQARVQELLSLWEENHAL